MKSKIEKALFVEDRSQLNQHRAAFSRIYFGTEFCERLLPSIKDFLAVKKFCEGADAKLSFVTPYLTDSGLRRVLPLVRLLSSSDELVLNDYGLLRAAEDTKARLVAGRLLNRQFRDPRILSFKGRVPKDFYQHLTQSNALSKEFQQFLLRHRIERAELDNLAQGISTDLSKSKLSGSLYFPFVFVSTSRMCLSANCDKISFYNKVGVLPCNRECMRYQFRLENALFPKNLFLFGNTIFFKNESLPKEKALLAKGIDRLVTNRTLMQSE